MEREVEGEGSEIEGETKGSEGEEKEGTEEGGRGTTLWISPPLGKFLSYATDCRCDCVLRHIHTSVTIVRSGSTD